MENKPYPVITKEAWEAMGVIYGQYITEHEAAILDKFAVENMMTREEAAKAILRQATERGEPPIVELPEKIQGTSPMLNMMMPRPIHRFLEQVGEKLGLEWFEHSRIVRAYIIQQEGSP